MINQIFSICLLFAEIVSSANINDHSFTANGAIGNNDFSKLSLLDIDSFISTSLLRDNGDGIDLPVMPSEDDDEKLDLSLDDGFGNMEDLFATEDVISGTDATKDADDSKAGVPTTTPKADSISVDAIDGLSQEEANEILEKYKKLTASVQGKLQILKENAKKKMNSANVVIKKYYDLGAKYAKAAQAWISKTKAEIPKAKALVEGKIEAAQKFANKLIGDAKKNAEQLAKGVQGVIGGTTNAVSDTLNGAAKAVNEIKGGVNDVVDFFKGLR